MTGFGFESGDPNLRDKIAALKAKRSAQSGKQRVEEFLEKELHVDPRDLPFDLASAEARMKEIMDGVGVDIADVQGNSMGLKAVVFKTSDYDESPTSGCPHCGTKTAGGYWGEPDATKGTGNWTCYECDVSSEKVPLPDTTVKTVTENEHGGEDWHDLKRCWNSYVGKLTYRHEDEGDAVTVYSFVSTKDWRNVSTCSTVPPDPNPDPTKYPTGATLRIQKAVYNHGDLDVERIYVRVGGLFSDTDIVNLATMEPITDLTGWTVVEVL